LLADMAGSPADELGPSAYIVPPSRLALALMRIFHAHASIGRMSAFIGVRMRRSSRRKVIKKAANLSVRSDLLSAAREAGVNLSAALEEALAAKVAAAKREQWARENADAIAAYNDFVSEHGAFGDDLRSF
jgi:antitoxin CcdA